MLNKGRLWTFWQIIQLWKTTCVLSKAILCCGGWIKIYWCMLLCSVALFLLRMIVISCKKLNTYKFHCNLKSAWNCYNNDLQVAHVDSKNRGSWLSWTRFPFRRCRLWQWETTVQHRGQIALFSVPSEVAGHAENDPNCPHWRLPSTGLKRNLPLPLFSAQFGLCQSLTVLSAPHGRPLTDMQDPRLLQFALIFKWKASVLKGRQLSFLHACSFNSLKRQNHERVAETNLNSGMFMMQFIHYVNWRVYQFNLCVLVKVDVFLHWLFC